MSRRDGSFLMLMVLESHLLAGLTAVPQSGTAFSLDNCLRSIRVAAVPLQCGFPILDHNDLRFFGRGDDRNQKALPID
jgi:hypothetical protein